MAGGQLNFPPEIMDAVSTMQKAAGLIDQEMQQLQTLVNGLTSSSKGAAVEAYNEAQQLWNKSGLAHNEALNGVAKAAGDSYQDITSFDSYLAGQLR
jgi:uncharacterized protein YukE